MWQSLVDAVKTEYNAIRLWPRRAASVDMESGSSVAPHSAHDEKEPRYPPLKSPCLGIYRTHNFNLSRRTFLNQETITLQGWPSRGGVIVLRHATRPDFDFLHLDTFDAPLRRDPDQTAEDTFCQGLLRLGATWWDSNARCLFISRIESGDEEAWDAVRADEDLEPTRRERGWVRVAWPSQPPGALCVLECEKLIVGRAGHEKLRPKNYGLISLARTMDERCDILQRLGGTMYASIDAYQGPTFLKAWEEDHQGDKGPLVKEEFIDPATYGGHPDEALGRYATSASPT